MRFNPRDAIWLWRKWTKAKADKLLAFGVKATAFVTVVSVLMAVLWWLPNEREYRRCLNMAQDSVARMYCRDIGNDIYDTLGHYLLAVVVLPVVIPVVRYLTRPVVGKYGRPRYYRHISWWVSVYCVLCLSGIVIQVIAWITFLAK